MKYKCKECVKYKDQCPECPDNPEVSGSAESAGSIAEVRKALEDFCGYALTCRTVNQPEWMEGLAKEINKLAELVGDGDRFYFDKDSLSLRQ